MFKQIVVGVDEHEGGRDAIALARHLLARDGQLTLAHVLPHDGHGYRGRSAAYEASGWASAAQLLEMVREETGVDAHLRWRVSGCAGRGLHELCELIGADLLAVGVIPAWTTGACSDERRHASGAQRRTVRDRDRSGQLLA